MTGQMSGSAASIEDRARASFEVSFEELEVIRIDVRDGAEHLNVDVGNLGIAAPDNGFSHGKTLDGTGVDAPDVQTHPGGVPRGYRWGAAISIHERGRP